MEAASAQRCRRRDRLMKRVEEMESVRLLGAFLLGGKAAVVAPEEDEEPMEHALQCGRERPGARRSLLRAHRCAAPPMVEHKKGGRRSRLRNVRAKETARRSAGRGASASADAERTAAELSGPSLLGDGIFERFMQLLSSFDDGGGANSSARSEAHRGAIADVSRAGSRGDETTSSRGRGPEKGRGAGNAATSGGGTNGSGGGFKWHGWRWQHCVSGAVAGGVVEIVMYPLDTLKTRLQTSMPAYAASAASPATAALTKTRSRTMSMFQRLRATGGVRGLYSGCVTGMVGTSIADAVYFGVYEPMKETCLSAMPEKYHAAAHAISAASASLIASVVRVPSEVIKQRMQSGQGFRSSAKVFSGILRNYGVSGLYNGIVPLLLRDLPFNTIEFAVYENLKITVKRLKSAAMTKANLVAAGDQEPAPAPVDWHVVPLTNFETGSIGALAGMFTAAFTTPMDVLKTRLMVQATGARYANVADAAVKIVREEGVHVLFQGLTPRLLWISFGGCIFFTALEGMEAILNKQRPVYSGLRGGAKAP